MKAIWVSIAAALTMAMLGVGGGVWSLGKMDGRLSAAERELAIDNVREVQDIRDIKDRVAHQHKWNEETAKQITRVESHTQHIGRQVDRLVEKLLK